VKTGWCCSASPAKASPLHDRLERLNNAWRPRLTIHSFMTGITVLMVRVAASVAQRPGTRRFSLMFAVCCNALAALAGLTEAARPNSSDAASASEPRGAKLIVALLRTNPASRNRTLFHFWLLGLELRCIRRKIAGNKVLQQRFADLLPLALRVRFAASPAVGQSLCAARPEVECIGKGKARAPYEFGCEVLVATPPPSPKAASLCRTPKHCAAIPSAATP
jgi:IS5 family transposase